MLQFLHEETYTHIENALMKRTHNSQKVKLQRLHYGENFSIQMKVMAPLQNFNNSMVGDLIFISKTKTPSLLKMLKEDESNIEKCMPALYNGLRPLNSKGDEKIHLSMILPEQISDLSDELFITPLCSLFSFAKSFQFLNKQTHEKMPPSFKHLVCGGFKEKMMDKCAKDEDLPRNSRFQEIFAMLNESQRKAVNDVLHLNIDGNDPVSLVIGPPGTGKSDTTMMIIAGLALKNPQLKIFQTGPTNTCVYEIFKRFLSNYQKFGFKEYDFLLACDTGLINEEVDGPFHLNSVVRKKCEILDKFTSEFESGNFDDCNDTISKIMNDTILSDLLVITSTSNADSLYETCVKIRKTAEQEIRNALVKKTKIMFATLGFAHSHSFKNTDFDICCVDEACQASEPETLPLLKDSLKRLVLIGDPNQLPAVINSKLSEQAGYGVSLFERLYKRNYPYVMLSTQYRMHPKISEFCSKNFYGGQLKDGPNVLSESYTKPWHSQRMFGPLVFFNQELALEEKCSTGSYVNSGEIDAIFSTLKDFFVKYPNSNATIGIVCLYKEQKKMMLEKINDFSKTLREIAEDPKLVASFLNNIDVNTVDGFQGQQRDIILLSLVRANKKGSLGFITDIKRVNVSLTRAKHSLWIFGNKDVVCINPTWKSVIDYIQSNGAVIPCNSKSLIFTNYTVADIQNKTELEEQCE